jgi:hypothetical protein
MYDEDMFYEAAGWTTYRESILILSPTSQYLPRFQAKRLSRTKLPILSNGSKDTKKLKKASASSMIPLKIGRGRAK